MSHRLRWLGLSQTGSWRTVERHSRTGRQQIQASAYRESETEGIPPDSHRRNRGSHRHPVALPPPYSRRPRSRSPIEPADSSPASTQVPFWRAHSRLVSSPALDEARAWRPEPAQSNTLGHGPVREPDTQSLPRLTSWDTLCIPSRPRPRALCAQAGSEPAPACAVPCQGCCLQQPWAKVKVSAPKTLSLEPAQTPALLARSRSPHARP